MKDTIRGLANTLEEEGFLDRSEELEELLSKAGFVNVKVAANSLRLISHYTGASPPLLGNVFAAAVESFDPDAGLNNMERYLSAVKDRNEVCAFLQRNNRILKALTTLFSGSQLLTDSFLQMQLSLDHLMEWLSEGDTADQPRESRTREGLCAALSDSLREARTLEEKGRLVRLFKKKEYIRIGLRDLLKMADTVETIRDLSNLADVCLKAAYLACHEGLVKRYGAPRHMDLDGREKECRFCIIGLGKLGGLELNFSSDIDIIYLYSSDEGQTEGVPGAGKNRINRISNHEYFNKLGVMITNFLSEITPDGNVFRVDLRLRPEGGMGDIAYSLRSYEIYYESYGVTLERQALIKARVCAGDRALGAKFISIVKPFIYRKHLDFTAIEEIKQMKESIDRRLRRDASDEGNVKLGYGGIREIEFAIQAFQLVYGGRDEKLQHGNLLEALDCLKAGGYLVARDHAALRTSYLFLRDLENRLQISHGLQTHTLPTDQRTLAVLSRKMGLAGNSAGRLADRLKAEYKKHIEAVREIYNDLFYSSARDEEPEASFDLEDRQSALSHLAASGFANPERALDNLTLLRDGPIFSHPSERSKLTFYRLLPDMLRLLSRAPDPDMALNYLESFTNSSQSRDTLFSLLLEEKALLDLLTRLFGTSAILSRIIIQQPNLLDTMLQREEMVSFKSRDELQEELLNALQQARDEDQRLTELRKFKQAEDLRIGLKYILGHQEVLETVAELTNLAEACLRVSLVIVEADLMVKYGAPVTEAGQRSKVVVIGMGKLGGREISFGSDLDILLAFSGDGSTEPRQKATMEIQSVPNHVYYARLYEGLLNALSKVTSQGYAYKIDMRLRPEGDKGAFALPLNKFDEYFERENQVWVRQAMIRARPVAGDPKLGNRFMASAHVFTYMKGLKAVHAKEIAHNRSRMEKELAREEGDRRDLKHGLGGITDIEFAIQLMQLKHGKDCPTIRSPGTLSALGELLREKLIDPDDHEQLEEAYPFLREVEMMLRIVEERPLHALPHSHQEQDKLARRLGLTAEEGEREGKILMSRYERYTTKVREIYKKMLAKAIQ